MTCWTSRRTPNYNCTAGYQCGQVETITNAAGHVTTHNTYNAHGQPLTITDPNGVVTTLTYDGRQRLTSRTVGSEQTTFTYWPTGLLRKATLPDGSFLEHTYDAAHRLTGMSDSAGNRIEYTLDAMGNRTAENSYDPSNALTQTRSRVYNTLSQLRKEIGAAGTAEVTTVYGYDDNGSLTSIAAPLGRNTFQTYDELNRLKQVSDPLLGITLYGYNALDQLITVNDPNGRLTLYTYNALGDLKRQISPDTGTTSLTYDAAGNIATRTDARGATVGKGIYSYDALNRPTQIQYPDHTISYTYDSCLNGIGRLCGMLDASGSTTYQYDVHGRVTRKTQTVVALTNGVSQVRTVEYQYSNGRLTGLKMPVGHTVNYTHDAAGRISAMSITWTDGTTAPLLHDVLYDPSGAVRGWTWEDGTLEIREYDQDGRVSMIESAGGSEYSYDDAGRITGIDALSGNPSPSGAYGYDSLDRLTSAVRPSLTQSFTYDANGNRLSEGGTNPSTYVYPSPPNNRLQSVSGALNRSYTYDAMGNVTSDGLRNFGYDGAGRMVSSGTAQFRHNGLGQRVRKSPSNGGHVTYMFDESGHLLEQCDASIPGNYCDPYDSQNYVWLGDIPVAALLLRILYNSDGDVLVSYIGLHHIHTDHLNTPRRLTSALTSSPQPPVWRWDSDPFGTSMPDGNPQNDPTQATVTMDLRFPGQIYDRETGLNYNYYRDAYDPAIGRYTQSDPIGLRGGFNTYEYVGSNPISSIDPLGLQEVAPRPRPNPIPGTPEPRIRPMPRGLPAPANDPNYRPRTGPRPGLALCANPILCGLGAFLFPTPIGEEWPDAANDPNFGDRECPPDCREFRTALNRMYHAIKQLESALRMSEGTHIEWERFRRYQKRYEQQCGPYTPPPSIEDVYTK